jgi:hypothetical protein
MTNFHDRGSRRLLADIAAAPDQPTTILQDVLARAEKAEAERDRLADTLHTIAESNQHPAHIAYRSKESCVQLARAALAGGGA